MITAKKSGGGVSHPVPEGNHVARIYQIIHLGTLPGFQGRLQNKVRLSFELPHELRVFREGEDGKPLAISQDYTVSLHEKSSLRGLIEACGGQVMSEEFNVEELLGATCLVNVKQKAKQNGQGTFSFIDGASPLPRGMNCPPPVNTQKVLSYSNWNQELFEGLPVFLREKMRESVEFKQQFGESEIPF